MDTKRQARMRRVDGVSSQVRRIAILVTSLDATAGRQLLLAMPQQLARDVRRAMASITSIDPEEQRRVLAEFRMQAMTSSDVGSTASPPSSLDSSTPAPTSSNSHSPMSAGSDSARGMQGVGQEQATQTNGALHSGVHHASQVEGNASSTSPTDAAGSAQWQRWDTDSLTELLISERAPVIAVVLSQLPPVQAARVLERIPKSQHRYVLAQLTHLRDIDPEAMRTIDEHLATRIADYHHRRMTETETAGRMQQLLAAASPEMKGDWQSIVADTDRRLADRLGLAVPQAAVAASSLPQSVNKSEPVATASSRTAQPQNTQRAAANSSAASLLDLLASNVLTTADQSLASTNSNRDDEPRIIPFPTARRQGSASGAITDMHQILDMPAEQIAQVLSETPGDVVLLAIAGATPQFMLRFNAMLEKQDARTLHQRIRQLGPINLQDVDAAQRRLCLIASRIVQSAKGAREQKAVAA